MDYSIYLEENQKIVTVLPYNFQVTTTTFINDILEINRIESNSVELEKISFNLKQLLKTLKTLNRSSC
jgi:hypothetical protein